MHKNVNENSKQIVSMRGLIFASKHVFDGKDNIKLKTVKQLSDEEKNILYQNNHNKDYANNMIKQNDFCS